MSLQKRFNSKLFLVLGPLYGLVIVLLNEHVFPELNNSNRKRIKRNVEKFRIVSKYIYIQKRKTAAAASTPLVSILL